MTYSALQVLRHKDFSQFTPEELAIARRILAGTGSWVGERRTRRKRPARHGAQTDLARVLRQNLKHGSEIVKLPYRTPRTKPRSLVILADVSGSMENYARIVLHLVHALYHQSQLAQSGRVQVFTFGTQLTYISPDLRRRSIDQALARIGQRVADWSGGTRIGDAIKAFNYLWARRVLRSSSVVLIISDGWDRGDLDLLGREMARLQKSCARLVWLNPLMGRPGFEPAALGLQAALPYVDDFLPIHNLVSLEQVVDKLAGIDTTRPARRQAPHHPITSAPAAPQIQFMPEPQMGTSDYVRRTLVIRPPTGDPPVISP
jgi:uncharacterized protein